MRRCAVSWEPIAPAAPIMKTAGGGTEVEDMSPVGETSADEEGEAEVANARTSIRSATNGKVAEVEIMAW